MRTRTEVRMGLAAFANTAWEYFKLSASVSTWGYRAPLPDEIQETMRRFSELMSPATIEQRGHQVSACCLAEIVSCCA